MEVSGEHAPVNLPTSKENHDTNVGLGSVNLTPSLRSAKFVLFGSCVSCSQTHSSVERPARDVEPFASFGKPLLKGERSRDFGECARFLDGKGRLLSDTEIPS